MPDSGAGLFNISFSPSLYIFFLFFIFLSALRCVLYILLISFLLWPIPLSSQNFTAHFCTVGNSHADVFSFSPISRPQRFRSQIESLQNSLGPAPGTTHSQPKVDDHHARTYALAWLKRQATHAHVFVGPRHCRSRWSRQVDDRAIVHHCNGANETRRSLRTTSSS